MARRPGSRRRKPWSLAWPIGSSSRSDGRALRPLRFRNTPPQLAALVATPSPQEDDMSDPKKASPRKPGLDESATAQAETSADDTAAARQAWPAAVADAEPAATAQPAAAAAAPRRTASAGNRAGDRPGCGPGRRAQGDARLRRRGARAVRPRRPGRSRRRLRRQGDACGSGPPRPARGPRRRGRGHRHPQPGAAGTVEPAQPAIDTAAIYAARNQHCR